MTKILPVAKALYLCDYQFAGVNGKSDLYGIFHGLRPKAYPHTQPRFCVFAQLASGLGELPFFIEIVGPDERLVYSSTTRKFRFPNRETVIQLTFEIKGCRFPVPGMYIVGLYCDNAWIADTQLHLIEA